MRGMKPLPMPIRVAAGLVATVIEEAEHLPRRLTELPVTAVSQALQHAMRVQQKVTDLAIKGDRALSALRPVPEAPTWARFDEDEAPPPANHPANFAGRFDDSDAFSAPYMPQPPRVTPVRILPDVESDTDRDTDVPAPGLPAGTADPQTEALRTDEPRAGTAPRPVNGTKLSRRSKAEPATGPRDEGRPAVSGPPGLDDYDEWSLPKLRARFRSLKPHQLQALLDWETAHQQRPPYLTMLSNRITSVTGQ